MTALLAQFGDFWIHPERVSSGHKHVLIFATLTCAVAIACLTLGPYPITFYPKDTLHFLTQGDLLLRGLRPYVDYYSMQGPVPFLFSAAGVHVRGVSLDAVILAQVIGAVVFGSMMFKVAASRVNGFWAVFLAVSIELVLVSCTPIGSKSWREFSCAMWYNAVGYCIQAIIFLYLLAEAQPRYRVSAWADHIVIAVLLMASFLTKLSYFLPTATTFFIGAVVLPETREARVQGRVILGLAALVTIALMGALGGSIGAYTEFIGAMSLRVPPMMLAFRFVHYTRTIGLLLLSLALLVWFAYEAGLLRQMRNVSLLAVLMFGSFLVSASTSAQDLEVLPLIGVIPLGLTVALATVAQRRSLPLNKYLITSALAIALLLVVHAPKNSILSWVFSHASVPTLAEPIDRLSQDDVDSMTVKLAPHVDPALFAYMPSDWTTHYAAAIGLLYQHGATTDEVLYVATDMSPLHMLTGARYPKGHIPWWPLAYLKEPGEIDVSDAIWILRDHHSKRFWGHLKVQATGLVAREYELVGTAGKWELHKRRRRGPEASSPIHH